MIKMIIVVAMLVSPVASAVGIGNDNPAGTYTNTYTNTNSYLNNYTNTMSATGGAGGYGGSGGIATTGAVSNTNGSVNGTNTATNAGNSISLNEARRPVNSAFAPTVFPTAPCMGSSSIGGGAAVFSFSGGTSWTSEECMILETARGFDQAGYADDGLSVRCQGKYAKSAPSCVALAKKAK